MVACRDNQRAIAARELFAMLVLWDTGQRWVGWLTTVDHRRTQFTAADLEDTGFTRWLTALPGWAADASSRLLYSVHIPGFHLIWRRSGGANEPAGSGLG